MFDSGDLAAAVVAMARYRPKDWSSLRKQTRHLETHSCVRQEAAGTRLPLAGPPRAGEDLVPLLPPTASRAVTVGEQPSWPFPLAVRLPGLGKVRLVVSVKNAALTGTDAGLVSHRVDGQAPRLLTLSLPRWPRETLYQDGQTSLGLDEDRRRNAAAMGQHGGLVFVASALVPLACFPPSARAGLHLRSPVRGWHNKERVNVQDLIGHIDLLCYILLGLDQNLPADISRDSKSAAPALPGGRR